VWRGAAQFMVHSKFDSTWHARRTVPVRPSTSRFGPPPWSSVPKATVRSSEGSEDFGFADRFLGSLTVCKQGHVPWFVRLNPVC
jgi:hypothetical protein